MRRDTLYGIGLILAGVAELQWASAFYGGDDTLLAAVVFVAGAGMFLAAGGALVRDLRTWAVWSGLGLAGVAHLAYFVMTLDFGPLLAVAAACAAAGLLAASIGARAARTTFERGGLALAAVGGVLWTAADLQSGSSSFMVGNVFATIGWAVAAFAAGPADA